MNAEGESATRFRTVRGGVADQPQQFFHAGALRLVEDDTAAVRFWRRGKRAFIFNFSNELNDHKLNHAACDFRTAEIRSVKLKAPKAPALVVMCKASWSLSSDGLPFFFRLRLGVTQASPTQPQPNVAK